MKQKRPKDWPPPPIRNDNFPTDCHDLQVEVFYQQGDDPFISGLWGAINDTTLDEVNSEFEEYGYSELFTHGSGDYLFSATPQPEQRGDFGRVEIPLHWELELIGFRGHVDPVTIKSGKRLKVWFDPSRPMPTASPDTIASAILLKGFKHFVKSDDLEIDLESGTVRVKAGGQITIAIEPGNDDLYEAFCSGDYIHRAAVKTSTGAYIYISGVITALVTTSVPSRRLTIKPDRPLSYSIEAPEYVAK